MTNKNAKQKWRAEKEKAKAAKLQAEATTLKPNAEPTNITNDAAQSNTDSQSTKSKSTKKRKPQKKKKAATTATPVPSEASIQARALSLEYLRNWKSSRETFKFQKVRQTWLVNHAFDRSKLPKSDFAAFLEYVADMQGASRQRLLERAQALVTEYKEKKAAQSEAADAADDDESPEAIKAKEFKRSYQRAKSLVEVLV